MSMIFDFFATIRSILDNVFSFIEGALSGLINLIKYLLKSVQMASEIVSTMPNWLQNFAFIVISFCVICLIVGRQHSKSD